MTSSAGQWWTETRAGGAELSCGRHETLEGPLGAAQRDSSSPPGTNQGHVPAPSPVPGCRAAPSAARGWHWGFVGPGRAGVGWYCRAAPPGLGILSSALGVCARQHRERAELSAGCGGGVWERHPHPLQHLRVGRRAGGWHRATLGGKGQLCSHMGGGRGALQQLPAARWEPFDPLPWGWAGGRGTAEPRGRALP